MPRLSRRAASAPGDPAEDGAIPSSPDSGCRMIDAAKYHAYGNDFLVLRAGAISPGQEAALSRAICDPHFGVGADGSVFLETDHSKFGVSIVSGSSTRTARRPACRATASVVLLHFCTIEASLETKKSFSRRRWVADPCACWTRSTRSGPVAPPWARHVFAHRRYPCGSLRTLTGSWTIRFRLGSGQSPSMPFGSAIPSVSFSRKVRWETGTSRSSAAGWRRIRTFQRAPMSASWRS